MGRMKSMREMNESKIRKRRIEKKKRMGEREEEEIKGKDEKKWKKCKDGMKRREKGKKLIWRKEKDKGRVNGKKLIWRKEEDIGREKDCFKGKRAWIFINTEEQSIKLKSLKVRLNYIKILIQIG